MLVKNITIFFLFFFQKKVTIVMLMILFGALLGMWVGIRNLAGLALGQPYLGALVVGITHSVCVCLLSLIGIMESNPSQEFSMVHWTLLLFTLSYFVNDLWVVTMVKLSWPYILHHIVSIFGLLVVISGGYGAQLLCELALLAECTNPLQNICEMFRAKNDVLSYRASQRVRTWFKRVFVLVRGPVFAAAMIRWYWIGLFSDLTQKIGFSAYVVQFTIWCIFLGSFYWISLSFKQKKK